MYGEWKEFGIELEFNSNLKQKIIIDIFKKFDYPIIETLDDIFDFESYVCKPDSSCGFEICSPILRSKDDLEQIHNIISSINDYCQNNHIHPIDKNCGLHVHIDIEDYDLLSFHNLIRNVLDLEENYFPNFLHSNRLNNNFCKFLDRPVEKLLHCKSMKEFKTKLKQTCDKYYGTNLYSYLEKSTIEFRYLHNTLDFSEISNWVQFLQKLVHKSHCE